MASAKQPLTLVDVDTVSPPPAHVLIDVAACGVCGTDGAVAEVGDVSRTSPWVTGWPLAGSTATAIDAVPCRGGNLMQCERLQVPSWHYPGGYAESVTAAVNALARTPDGLSFVEAAPLECAGVTTFNGLRQTRAVAGDLVAVLGIGGLSHLVCSGRGQWDSRPSSSPAVPPKPRAPCAGGTSLHRLQRG